MAPAAPPSLDAPLLDSGPTVSPKSQASEPVAPAPVKDAGEVKTQPAQFSQLTPAGILAGGGSMDLLTDISVTLTARLGKTVLTIGEILKLGPGATVSLDRFTHQPVDLLVGGKVFASGDVVVVNDCFAIRIKELLHGGSEAGGNGR